MTAAKFTVGSKVQIKRKQEYAAPHVAEHAGKIGRVTHIADNGDVTLKLEPTRLGLTATGVVRGRNSQGLRLVVGHNDLEHVKEGRD